MEGNFKRFSLFFGIEIEGFQFFPGGEFSNSALFSAQRIALFWNVPALLVGKIKISEIGLSNAEIRLEERNGISNLSKIITPKPKSEPETESPPLEQINTYLPLQISTYLNIENLTVFVTSDTSELQNLTLQDLSLELNLVSNRFTSIPLNLDIVDQLDYFSLALNKQRPIPINLVTNKIRWNQTIPLMVNLEWDRTVKPELFLFTSNFGHDNILLEVKNKPVEIGARFFSDINFKPEADLIEIKNIFLKIMGSSWIRVQGQIKDLSKDSRSLEVKIIESNILLSPLQKVINQLEGVLPDIKVGGELSLFGTELTGNWSNVQTKVLAKGSNVIFALGKTKSHTIGLLNLNIESELNLDSKKEKTKEIPFPILYSAKINPLELNYNGAQIFLSGNYSQGSGVDLTLNLDKLDLGSYVNTLNGKLKSELIVKGEDLSNLLLNLKSQIDNFRYTLERSRSPFSSLSLNTNLNIIFEENFKPKRIDIGDLSLDQKTTAQNRAISLGGKGSVLFGDTLDLYFNPIKLDLRTSNLLLVLPLVLKEKVAPLQNLLGESPSLNLNVEAKISSLEKKILTSLNAKLPGIELNDLIVKSEILISGAQNDIIQLKKFNLEAFQKILKINASANLKKSNLQSPPLGPYIGVAELGLNLNSSEKKYLLKGISFKGAFGLNLNIKDYDILGSLKSEASVVSYTNSKCPGDNCKVFLIDGINSNVPIEHSLNHKQNESMIVGDKSIFLKTYGRELPPNISINQVIGTHPNIPDLPFEYIKKQKDGPGFIANIQYKENFLNIEGLRAYSLDGLVSGKNILVNLGSMSPKEMELRGNILVRDIDLKQLMAPKVRDKIDDGKIKADLNISLRDFSEPIANLDLFFSIFQIGKDFGKSALNVISQQNFLIDRIADSYSINKIEISLSKGLVYADVFFRRSLLSLFINLEDSKISQQRMPLANFLKRAQNEIETYQE